MSRYIRIDNLKLTKLWHCFGSSHHLADMKTVIEIANHSRSNVLPVNTHNLDFNSGRKGLELGYAGVSLDELAEALDTSEKIIMLNINLQTSARCAVAKTLLAFQLTGEKMIKLEVLNEDYLTSNQSELILAYQMLKNIDESLEVLPLIDNDYAIAAQLVGMGCSLLRVMGSKIGGCKGIIDKSSFRKICSLGVPVILDGGIGHVDDAIEALFLGAQGVLVNSMLFEQSIEAGRVMGDFSHRFYSAVDTCSLTHA